MQLRRNGDDPMSADWLQEVFDQAQAGLDSLPEWAKPTLVVLPDPIFKEPCVD